jgi:hypothetical protein
MAELGVSPVPIRKISVQIEGPGYRDVSTVSDLTALLMSGKWPKKAGNTTFQRALALCSPLWKIRAAALRREKPSSMRLEMPESP